MSSSTTLSEISRPKTATTKKVDDSRRTNKITHKAPMTSAAITSISTETLANSRTPETENPNTAKSEDLMTSPEDVLPDVTSPGGFALADAAAYGTDTVVTSAGVSHPSDVTIRYSATTSESSWRPMTESTVSEVTSQDESAVISFTDQVVYTTSVISTPLPKTPTIAISFPPTVLPTEVPSTRRIPPSTMSSTAVQTAPWPTKQRTSYRPTTPSYSLRTRRPPKKTKPRRPTGTKWTADLPAVRPNSRCNNNAPVIKNPIGKLIHEAGSVLTFQVANDTFVDCEV